MKKIILASASPRRKELLEQIGLKFVVCPATGEENITSGCPDRVVEELSYGKALEVANRQSEDDILVIGADTVVAYGGQIMGKPENEQGAAKMLRMLSGKTHSVYTGVTAVLLKDGKRMITTFSEETKVTFYDLSESEIEEYISTGEPMDKAGSYGIQGLGSRFVEKIEGDYNNVVGFPLARFYHEILRRKQIIL